MQRLGPEPGFLEDVGRPSRELGLAKQARLDIDTDRELPKSRIAALPVTHLAAGVAHHPPAQWSDQAAFFSEGNKDIRADDSAYGVKPPQQRLEPDHLQLVE